MNDSVATNNDDMQYAPQLVRRKASDKIWQIKKINLKDPKASFILQKKAGSSEYAQETCWNSLTSS